MTVHIRHYFDYYFRLRDVSLICRHTMLMLYFDIASFSDAITLPLMLSATISLCLHAFYFLDDIFATSSPLCCHADDADARARHANMARRCAALMMLILPSISFPPSFILLPARLHSAFFLPHHSPLAHGEQESASIQAAASCSHMNPTCLE